MSGDGSGRALWLLVGAFVLTRWIEYRVHQRRLAYQRALRAQRRARGEQR